MGKYIRFDWAMKKLLRDKANFEVLEGLISTLLDKDIHIVKLLESESNRKHEKDKQNRVDILAEDENETKYIIEVQNRPESEYFHRMLYGTSKLVTEYLEKGRPYSEIPKVFSINIVYFDLGTGTDIVYRGSTEFRGIHNDEILKLSPFQQKSFEADAVRDLFPEFFILRVNEFNDIATTPLEEWFDLLKNEKISEHPKAKGLAKAREVLLYNNMSEEEQGRYDEYVTNMLIAEDNARTVRGEALLEGEVKGIQEGIQKGIQKGKYEVAQKLKEMGLPMASISEATDIPITELEEFLNNQKD